MIQFVPLDKNVELSAAFDNDFKRMRELISSLAPDFETFLWNGKLDAEAIGDCATFMNAVVGMSCDR
eukprot:2521753-Pleurochrysis_carterae.AAC.1